MLLSLLWSCWNENSPRLPENPNFRCCCGTSVSLGPRRLSAKHLGREPLVVLVSPEVLGILQHVTSLLTLALKLSYCEFWSSFLKKELFELFLFPLFLQADEDPIMGFHQIFLLKNINDAWVCTNDMFRLALHNFG